MSSPDTPTAPHKRHGLSKFLHHLLPHHHHHHHSKHLHGHHAAAGAGGAQPVQPHAVNGGLLHALGFNNETVNLLQRVDSRLERLVEETRKILKAEGVKLDLEITQGFRTAQEQHRYFLRGASKDDGYRHKSNHQSGRAIDFSLYDPNGKYEQGNSAASVAKYSQAAQAFQLAAQRLNYRDVKWGGNWRGFKDIDHIEIGRQPQIQMASTTPPKGPKGPTRVA